MLFNILIAALSIPLAYLIAYKTKEEFKEGKKYFNILSLSIFILLAFLTFSLNNYSLLILGIILSISLKKPYLSLGFALLISFQLSKQLLITSLIFIISLPLSTLNFHKINKFRILIQNIILLSMPSLFIFTKFDFQPLTTGLLIGNILLMIKNVIFNRHWLR